ncbi:MAG: carboxypeptidase-like regulatory domain-containing protein, partial [Fulvivirga sp.]
MAIKFLKNFPPFILMMVISTNLIAQNAFVKGKLVDKNSLEPLPYANIVLLSKNAVYSTDSLGRFSIPYTNETDSLMFLFLGYQELLVPIYQINKDYTVLLESTVKTLQEIEIKA